MTRKPFIGAVYERKRPVIDPWTKEVKAAAPRVEVISCDVTYFDCPGVLVSMLWREDFGPPPLWRTSDNVKFNLEDFLSQFRPINNVVYFRSRGNAKASDRQEQKR